MEQKYSELKSIAHVINHGQYDFMSNEEWDIIKKNAEMMLKMGLEETTWTDEDLEPLKRALASLTNAPIEQPE
jgi:hypothetical protein